MSSYSELVNVVKSVATELHRHNMHLILVIPSSKEGYAIIEAIPHVCVYMSYYRSALFGSGDFKKLVDFVDGFSLMTYDYSTPQR